MPDSGEMIHCPYLNASVELTEERELHIASHHPDLLPEFRNCIFQTVSDPDQVRRSVRFLNARIFSKWFDTFKDGKTRCSRCSHRSFRIRYEALDNHRIIARLNPGTNAIENLEVLFFSTRLLRSDIFELPVLANFQLSRQIHE